MSPQAREPVESLGGMGLTGRAMRQPSASTAAVVRVRGRRRAPGSCMFYEANESAHRACGKRYAMQADYGCAMSRYDVRYELRLVDSRESQERAG